MTRKQEVNPLEDLVEELAQEYVDMVKQLAAEFAPIRPWWHKQLSPDQQLWRWLSGPRNEIMEWIYKAGAHMGWETPEEVLAKWETIFTDPTAQDLIPLSVIAELPIELLEMVQAAGPQDAGKHVRKMERMMEGRAAAIAQLEHRGDEVPQVPEPPFAPPPLPVELIPGTAGWPLYGMAPRDAPDISAAADRPPGY